MKVLLIEPARKCVSAVTGVRRSRSARPTPPAHSTPDCRTRAMPAPGTPVSSSTFCTAARNSSTVFGHGSVADCAPRPAPAPRATTSDMSHFMAEFYGSSALRYTPRVPSFFQIRKKVHWSDTDAAGVVWFPNFLRWFEDAEEELFASLGRSRQSLLDSHHFGMPRVEVHSKFRAPGPRRPDRPRRDRHHGREPTAASSRLRDPGRSDRPAAGRGIRPGRVRRFSHLVRPRPARRRPAAGVGADRPGRTTGARRRRTAMDVTELSN